MAEFLTCPNCLQPAYDIETGCVACGYDGNSEVTEGSEATRTTSARVLLNLALGIPVSLIVTAIVWVMVFVIASFIEEFTGVKSEFFGFGIVGIGLFLGVLAGAIVLVIVVRRAQGQAKQPR